MRARIWIHTGITSNVIYLCFVLNLQFPAENKWIWVLKWPVWKRLVIRKDEGWEGWQVHPRTHKGRGQGFDTTPSIRFFFLSFFLEDKTSVPDVFSTSSFISRTHFETSLVMDSCYGYELWPHKYVKVTLVAKIMQSCYLCVVFHVKHKKILPFLAVNLISTSW